MALTKEQTSLTASTPGIEHKDQSTVWIGVKNRSCFPKKTTQIPEERRLAIKKEKTSLTASTPGTDFGNQTEELVNENNLTRIKTNMTESAEWQLLKKKQA